jgi:hypothetical protein
MMEDSYLPKYRLMKVVKFGKGIAAGDEKRQVRDRKLGKGENIE